MNKYFFVGILCVLSFGVFAQPANDNYANAIDVTGLIGICSSNALYTNVNATADLNGGDCWDTQQKNPERNVWFKFTATASGTMNVTIKTNGAEGTIQNINGAI